jgi:hypothetical protein
VLSTFIGYTGFRTKTVKRESEMPENDFHTQIDKIIKRAQKDRKQEMAEEKAKETEKKKKTKAEKAEEKKKKAEEKAEKAREKAKKIEAEKITKAEPESSPKEGKKMRKSSYTAVIVAKVDYQGDNIPAKEQLAEELGRIIINWADQKKFYAISQKEPSPELISIDIDIQ